MGLRHGKAVFVLVNNYTKPTPPWAFFLQNGVFSNIFNFKDFGADHSRPQRVLNWKYKTKFKGQNPESTILVKSTRLQNLIPSLGDFF